MQFIEATYREVERGMSLETATGERIAREDIRKVLEYNLKGWLDGKLEPYSYKEIGNSIAKTRMMNYSTKVPNLKKKGKLKWQFAEEPISRRSVVAVKFWSRDENNEEYDHETGDSVKPRMAICCVDGSVAYVRPKYPKDVDKNNLKTGYEGREKVA
jgi:hypothetical protein